MQINKVHICHYCQEPTKNPTRDHIYPISKIRKLREKGEPLPEDVDIQNNKVIACGVCNTLKGTLDYDSFIAQGVEVIRHKKQQFLNKTIAKHGRKRAIRKKRKYKRA